MSNGLATMDFFGQQDAARSSRLLVFLYAFSVLLICSIIGGGVWVVYAMQTGEKAPVHPVLVALVAAIITGLVIGGGSLYRITLPRRRFDRRIGARRQLHRADTTDPDERGYSTSSKKWPSPQGVPVPPVYLRNGDQRFRRGLFPGRRRHRGNPRLHRRADPR